MIEAIFASAILMLNRKFCVKNSNKGIPQPGTRPPEASPGKKTKKPPLASPTPRTGKKARKPPLASPTPRSKAKAAAAAALANNAPLTPGVLATQAGGPMPAALRYSPMRKMYELIRILEDRNRF